MITSYHRGMQHDVSVGDFRVELVKRRVSALEANARKVAHKIHRVVLNLEKGGLVLNMNQWHHADACHMLNVADEHLFELAQKYGVPKELIPYTVEYAKELLHV